MKKIIILSIVMASIMLVASCKKSSDNASNSGGSSTNSDVRVETYTPQDITATSAVCGGDAIVTQGLSLTEIGVCWSTSINPTIEAYHWSTTVWNEPYVCTLEYLTPNTKYYVRAYALRGLEYYYGETKSFTTIDGAVEPTPEGAISGIFSISEGNRIYFSKGNLQYKASNDTWRFADNQWDYVGEDNTNISPSYNGWIDLFGCGTGNNPTNTSTNWEEYTVFHDWGNNNISNGGNTSNWRTLTNEEWDYIFNSRITTSGIRYVKAKILKSTNSDTINGVIVLPDYWRKSEYSFNNINSGNVGFNANIIIEPTWHNLESLGAIFLPAAGIRYNGTIMSYVGFEGTYWSAVYVPYGSYDSPYIVTFSDDGLWITWTYYLSRPHGYSVRLVQNAN